MKNKKEIKAMKMVFAVWYWNLHCHPSESGSHWMVKPFGSESRAKTWISHNFWQLFQAEGLHIEIECEADLPNVPPDGAKLLVGERGSKNYSRGGRYPVVEFPIGNQIHKHQRTVADSWRPS